MKLKVKSEKLKVKNRGFTLVELLIVIALIGILAGAIVATLNPVEQVNKARDAKYDNETAELLAGMERYYASLQLYPWMEMQDDVELEDAGGWTSVMYGAGICGAANYAIVDSIGIGPCTIGGRLIDAQEVKPAFINKTQFDPTQPSTEFMYILKEAGAGGSDYSCFIPKSNTNRQNAARLRCLNTLASGAPTGFVKAGDGSCAVPLTASDPAWQTGLSSADNAIFFCVPE